MDNDTAAANDKEITSSSPKRTRRRAGKVVEQPLTPLLLPQPLAMVVDYFAYMSKYSGPKLSYEAVVEQAVILLAETLAKGGNQLPPAMAARLAEFKAAHPAFRSNPPA